MHFRSQLVFNYNWLSHSFIIKNFTTYSVIFHYSIGKIQWDIEFQKNQEYQFEPFRAFLGIMKNLLFILRWAFSSCVTIIVCLYLIFKKNSVKWRFKPLNPSLCPTDYINLTLPIGNLILLCLRFTANDNKISTQFCHPVYRVSIIYPDLKDVKNRQNGFAKNQKKKKVELSEFSYF